MMCSCCCMTVCVSGLPCKKILPREGSSHFNPCPVPFFMKKNIFKPNQGLVRRWLNTDNDSSRDLWWGILFQLYYTFTTNIFKTYEKMVNMQQSFSTLTGQYSAVVHMGELIDISLQSNCLKAWICSFIIAILFICYFIHIWSCAKHLNAEFPETDKWDSCFMNICWVWKQEMTN